jgi:hypothetical protein
VVRTRLWTWWDTATLVAYELVVIVIILLVPSGWQFPAYLVSVAALAFGAYRFLRRTARGSRIRASLPSGSDSTPTWLLFAAAFAVTVPLALVAGVFGLGDPNAWTMTSAGGLIVSFRLADRWWTARAGAPA